MVESLSADKNCADDIPESDVMPFARSRPFCCCITDACTSVGFTFDLFRENAKSLNKPNVVLGAWKPGDTSKLVSYCVRMCDACITVH